MPAVPIPSFPLLVKELIESASRKRTYWTRSAYAVVVFGAFAVLYLQQAAQYRDLGQMGMLGRGGGIFDSLVWLQMTGVLLVMPALSAGAFAREKERGSLVLLLLTPMTRWDLVLQKWLSRQIEMACYVLSAMPLIVITYAYGGYTTAHFWTGIGALFGVSMQIGALALLMSAWCRTTVSALVATYVTMVLLHGIDVAGDSLLMGSSIPSLSALDLLRHDHDHEAWSTLLPMLVTVPGLLLMTRLVLTRRALTTSGTNWLHTYMRWFDRTLGRVAVRRAATVHALPGEDPVAWRERSRRALTSWPSLLRMLLPIEILVVSAIATIGLSCDERTASKLLILLFSVLLGMAVLALLVLGACLFANERTGQTLEVLLTTPLSPKDMVAQKMRGLENIFWALLIVLVTAVVAMFVALPMAGAGALAMFVFTTFLLPPYMFFTVWIGLVIPHTHRALVTAMVGVLALALGSILTLVALGALFAPLALIVPIGYLILMRWLRERCYGYADVYLRR